MKTDVTLNLSEGSIDYEQETEDDDPNYNETEEFRKYMDGEVFYGVHCRNSNRGRCFSYGRKCRRGQIKRENKNVFKAILGYDPRSSRGFFYNQQKVPLFPEGPFVEIKESVINLYYCIIYMKSGRDQFVKISKLKKLLLPED